MLEFGHYEHVLENLDIFLYFHTSSTSESAIFITFSDLHRLTRFRNALRIFLWPGKFVDKH